jgi:hypothetical protein
MQPPSDLAVGRIRQVGIFVRDGQPLLDPTVEGTSRQLDLMGGHSQRIESPIFEHELRDEQLHPDGKPYRFAVCAFRMIAVNRWGHESGPSPVQFTFPAAVQGVFAREEGDSATRLRWESKPGARFHVYRHNGRYDKSPIMRLTDQPIHDTEFLDETAGRDTRRYEIVAVDALGQEGAPSQPVWSRREWRKYYLPYTQEWHQ